MKCSRCLKTRTGAVKCLGQIKLQYCFRPLGASIPQSVGSFFIFEIKKLSCQSEMKGTKVGNKNNNSLLVCPGKLT